MIRRFGLGLLDLFFPPRCVGCQKMGQWLCDMCAQDVQPVPQPACTRCGRPLPNKDSQPNQTPAQASPFVGCARCHWTDNRPLYMVQAATLHTTPMRPAIHALKYEGRVELADSLARYLYATVQKPPWSGILPEVDGIVPVPLHPERMQERGYNQALLLAESFATRLRLPVFADGLTRVRATRSQVGLSARERSENVQDAFVGNSRLVQGHTLILLDDVYTTGATMMACAAALVAAGAKQVYGLALAMPDPAEAGSPGGPDRALP